jgi:hypothetical protein
MRKPYKHYGKEVRIDRLLNSNFSLRVPVLNPAAPFFSLSHKPGAILAQSNYDNRLPKFDT